MDEPITHEKFKEMIKNTFQELVDDKTIKDVDIGLINAAGNYVYRQVNEFSITSKINNEQYAAALKDAWKGLYILVFVTHYRAGSDLVSVRPVYYTFLNLMKLMFSHVLHGNYAQHQENMEKAKQPITLAGVR